jgi:hypothetical protein
VILSEIKGGKEMIGNDFVEAAIEAGFTHEQADFLDQWLAKFPHSHDVSEIDGLEDAIEEGIEEELAEGEGEE